MSVKRFLYSYCIKHDCTFKYLAKKTGISSPRLRELDRGKAKDMKVSNCIKLYNVTKEEFKDPITPWDLIEFNNDINEKTIENLNNKIKNL